MDAFLEELKREQDAPASGYGHGKGGMSAGSSGPSMVEQEVNIAITHLHPNLNEAVLCEEFGVFGPIGSVKIMWPRSHAEVSRGYNTGFVCFMKRRDAERALRKMDGKDLLGMTVKTSWGKPMLVPAQPFYVHPSLLDEDGDAGVDYDANKVYPFGAKRVKINVPGGTKSRWEVRVEKPTDFDLLQRIHRTIERVLVLGKDFEVVLMNREMDNPDYQFLVDNTLPEHVYYRWKLYSLTQGDSLYRWRTRPFRMFDDKPSVYWYPPSLPFTEELSGDERDYDEAELYDWDSDYGDDPEDSLDPEHEEYLERKFRNMIRKATLERRTIGCAMAFAMDHPTMDYALMDILVTSILSPSASVFPAKIARLFILNDLICNATKLQTSQADRFKSLLEDKLPRVFEHLNALHRAIEARLKAEQMKTMVMGVLEAWETEQAYSPASIERLKMTFLRREPAAAVGQGWMQPDAVLPGTTPLLPSVSLPMSNIQGLISTSTLQVSDEQRRQLREIEGKVSQYTKQLEQSGGSAFGTFRDRLAPAQIAKKAQEYREKLMAEWNSSSSNAM